MKTKSTYEINGRKHSISPFSAVFPPMTDEEFEEFKKHVKDNGLKDPIVYTDPRNGRVIEGRHRLHAVEEIGSATLAASVVFMPAPVPLPVTDDAIKEFVLAKNMHRRHLSTGQRAMIAASLSNIDYKTTLQNLAKIAKGEETGGTTVKQAASAMNVSPRAVKQARRVKKHPDLADAVTDGSMTLNSADTEASKREGGTKNQNRAPVAPAPVAPAPVAPAPVAPAPVAPAPAESSSPAPVVEPKMVALEQVQSRTEANYGEVIHWAKNANNLGQLRAVIACAEATCKTLQRAALQSMTKDSAPASTDEVTVGNDGGLMGDLM